MVRSRTSSLKQARCACTACGAHAVAVVGRVVVSGTCPCCGGHDLERIGPLQELGDDWGGSLPELAVAQLA